MFLPPYSQFGFVDHNRPKQYYKDQELLQKIGNRIRETRIAKGLSIEDLANESEVDYSQINRMELGKVNFNISLLYKISTALEVHPSTLLP